MSRFRPGSQPRLEQLFAFRPRAPARYKKAPATFGAMAPIPNNYTVPEARSRAAPVCHRRRAAANPQKPYPEAPKKPDSGPEPEQIYAYKAPSRPRTSPPPPARGVWYYSTSSSVSSTIFCVSCSITSTSGVTFTMRDSAKRLNSASLSAI